MKKWIDKNFSDVLGLPQNKFNKKPISQFDDNDFLSKSLNIKNKSRLELKRQKFEYPVSET